MEKRIKVSYTQDWNSSGTHYDQLIRIPFELKGLLDSELETAKTARKHSILFNNYDYIYLVNEFYAVGCTYLTLTNTRLVKYVLDKQGQDTKRLKLDRNTRIQFY